MKELPIEAKNQGFATGKSMFEYYLQQCIEEDNTILIELYKELIDQIFKNQNWIEGQVPT